MTFGRIASEQGYSHTEGRRPLGYDWTGRRKLRMAVARLSAAVMLVASVVTVAAKVVSKAL
jgi:hypothetical protein